ncbi:MAG: hypothetical protein BGN92_12660 [Sphingobacteriales bacterium 41-5]|nr:MAG: hypothetical protein BGN92_12660 [Sphingobacteriales bacterium 41-5]
MKRSVTNFSHPDSNREKMYTRSSLWYEDQNLYKFEAQNETSCRKYEITFNPETGILIYLEYSDRLKL